VTQNNRLFAFGVRRALNPAYDVFTLGRYGNPFTPGPSKGGREAREGSPRNDNQALGKIVAKKNRGKHIRRRLRVIRALDFFGMSPVLWDRPKWYSNSSSFRRRGALVNETHRSRHDDVWFALMSEWCSASMAAHRMGVGGNGQLWPLTLPVVCLHSSHLAQ